MPHKDPEAAKAYKRAYYRDYRKGIRRTDRSELSDEEVVRRYRERVEKDKAKRRKYGPVETSDQKLIREAKSQPCVDCGKTYPHQIMHLDHVRGKKRFQLSKRTRAKLPKDPQKRQKLIREEIAKCDNRCPNCHRMRHWRLGEIGNPDKRDFQLDPDAPDPRKPAQEEWEARAADLGVELLEPVVKTKNVFVAVRCLECSYEWEVQPTYIQTGKIGCRSCSYGKRKIKQEIWDERAKALNLVWLEPVKGANHKSRVRCLSCNQEFRTTGAQVNSGHGCRDCRNKERGKKNRLPQSVWDERIAKVNARWLEPLETGDKRARAECLKCGKVWNAWPSRITAGHGCSDCKRREKIWKPRGYAVEVLRIIEDNPGIRRSEILKKMPHVKDNGTITYSLKRLQDNGFVKKSGKGYAAK
jgi:hypothetical protein